MKVLVVDDESGKRERVVAHLRGLGIEHIDEARSFQSAMERIESAAYDWVVLDMRLTSFDVSAADDGGRPRNVGGDEVLRKMARKGIISRVIVLTQYSVFREGAGVLTLDAFQKQLREKYPIFHSLIQFQHSNLDWQDRIAAIITGEGNESPDRRR